MITKTITYAAADGSERTMPALRVRARYATIVTRYVGGRTEMAQVAAGAELWSPLTNRRTGMPTDPRELFGVVVPAHYGRPVYMGGQSAHFEAVQS